MKASGQQVSNPYNVRAQQRQLLISSYSFATDIGLSVYMRVFEGLHTEHGYVRIMYRTLIYELDPRHGSGCCCNESSLRSAHLDQPLAIFKVRLGRRACECSPLLVPLCLTLLVDVSRYFNAVTRHRNNDLKWSILRVKANEPNLEAEPERKFNRQFRRDFRTFVVFLFLA
jgi:hypothetical protein